MIKRIGIILSFIAVIGASFYAGQLTVDQGYTGDTEISDPVFLEVLDNLIKNHYSQPTKEELMEGALEGMLGALDDPHSSYFDAEAYAQFQSNFGESYVGIGVRVMFVDNLIVVEEVFDGGPAEEAGIRPNDIIAYVDGEEVLGDDFYEILSQIIGDEGTDVTIGVLRAGVDDIIFLTMTRAVIDNSSVTVSTFVEGSATIGYIEVSQFGDETADKFEDAIDQLETEGVDSMIIDLRNNGGGHLSTVLRMLREFLIRNGSPMFSTEYYSDGELNQDDYYAINTEYKNYNIVTLINGGSASASEVFASSMQEHGGYPLVGNLSYGKGTMQIDMVLRATVSDRLHISIGRWLTSDGNWVHFNGGTDGITPDIVVEPTVYETAYKLFLFDGETFVYDQVDDRIVNMQYLLTIMGYDVREDGYFDAATRDAILDIQANNGLTEDGIVTNEVLQPLNTALDQFQDDPNNDSQLLAAIDYLVENPTRD